MCDLTVRADYYNDGTIIPISICYNGNSYLIDSIKKTIKTNRHQYEYICKSKDLELVISYRDNKWNVIKIE